MQITSKNTEVTITRSSSMAEALDANTLKEESQDKGEANLSSIRKRIRLSREGGERRRGFSRERKIMQDCTACNVTYSKPAQESETDIVRFPGCCKSGHHQLDSEELWIITILMIKPRNKVNGHPEPSSSDKQLCADPSHRGSKKGHAW